MAFLLLLITTWLVASIPFGVVVTSLYGDGRDIRQVGSGNIGATNVARVFGWRLAGPVLLLDMAKGLLPVVAARLLWPDLGVAWLGAVGLLAFLSHCFPLYLRFRGGKGVATSAGVLLGLTPGPALGAIGMWVVLLALTGRSSVAALGATAGMVLLVALVDPVTLPVVVLLAVGIAFTHTPNLRRLVRGEEGQVVQPVRWKRPEHPDPARLLDQAPSGVGDVAPPPLWREVGAANEPLTAETPPPS